MKNETVRTFFLFAFIILSFYCYGAGMMDYFAIYEPWKLIRANDFAAFHQYQGSRIIKIFVIPSAVMTIFNLLAVIFPVRFIPVKLLWASLLAYAFDWIFSFTMQIPIQLELETRKDMQLITELLYTNRFRFAADTLQFLILCILLWQLLVKAQLQSKSIRLNTH